MRLSSFNYHLSVFIIVGLFLSLINCSNTYPTSSRNFPTNLEAGEGYVGQAELHYSPMVRYVPKEKVDAGGFFCIYLALLGYYLEWNNFYDYILNYFVIYAAGISLKKYIGYNINLMPLRFIPIEFSMPDKKVFLSRSVAVGLAILTEVLFFVMRSDLEENEIKSFKIMFQLLLLYIFGVLPEIESIF